MHLLLLALSYSGSLEASFGEGEFAGILGWGGIQMRGSKEAK